MRASRPRTASQPKKVGVALTHTLTRQRPWPSGLKETSSPKRSAMTLIARPSTSSVACTASPPYMSKKPLWYAAASKPAVCALDVAGSSESSMSLMRSTRKCLNLDASPSSCQATR